MNRIFLWLTPPLIGALIGYVTNALAIKMLFRPLREARIFGIRLPFTPGILPRQRRKLADSIGAMVERELLTAEMLQERIRREDARQAAKNAVARYRARFLNTPLKSLAPPRDVLERASFSRLLYSLLDTALTAIIEEIRNPGKDALGSRSLREIIGDDAAAQLNASLEGVIRSGLESSASRFSEYLVPLVEEVLPEITAGFISFLKKPEIHGKLEIQGRIFLDNAIFKLNSLQRFFITAGQYNRTLHDKMPEIIDDLIRQLEELLAGADVRSRISAFLGGAAEHFLASERAVGVCITISQNALNSRMDTPLEELARMWDGQAFRRIILRNLENGEASDAPLGRFLSRIPDAFLLEYGERSLGELLTISEERQEKIDRFISEKILAAAGQEIPAVLEAIDVRALVSDRINALDMPRVERIVLDVMASQFKWINLFGGVLGALIGVFQSVFSWLTR
ncbi:MAG: DUF445 family protein [Treponema sp.]|nr:DUF445 family protein [Treponema sp.]